MLNTAPVAIPRRDLVELIDAAYNHIIAEKMVGLFSTTGHDLENALLDLPCLYCGMVGLVHDDSCDREFWRGETRYERILREHREEA